VAFFLDLWDRRPRHLWLRAVRADSGFYLSELLTLWEQLHLPNIVVAKLTEPIQRLLRQDLVRTPTELAGTDLTVLFQRHLGWQTKVTIHSLRFWLFVTPGIVAHPAGKTLIKLAVPPRERDWWSRLWEKILSPFPNCNAVENRPVFAG
jgi:hypothetical protein